MNLCGSCKVCCERPKMRGFKEANTLCSHYCNGCKIYNNRPLVCRTFECHWLQSGLPIEFRPDYLGAMAYTKRGATANSIRIILAESEPESFAMENLTDLQQQFFALLLKKANYFCTELNVMRAA